jgi:hypothetical protein
MNKGVWAGSLILGLGAWVSNAAGQSVPWHAPGSGLVPVSDVHLEPVPSAELGRPEALPPAPAQAAAPTSFKAASSILPAGFESPGLLLPPAASPMPLPRSVRVGAGDVIAASAGLPTTYPDEEDPNSVFAGDRPVAVRDRLAPVRLVGASTVGPVTEPLLPPPAPPLSTAVPTTWTRPDAVWSPWGPEAGPDGAPGAGGAGPWNGLAGTSPHPQRGYLTGEYQLWWVKGYSIPVLLTTSAATDFGILGRPTTQVLFGGNTINDRALSGGRFYGGWWLDCDYHNAFEVGGLFLGHQDTTFMANSGQFPTLGRPFFNVNTGQQFSQLVALPGVTTGSAIVNAPSNFWGAEANWRHQLCCGCNWHLNTIAGFRYLDLDESLKITEIIQGLPTAPAPFTNEAITVFDRFATHNRFYGGQIGLDGRWVWGCWSLEGRVKLGMGVTEQDLSITGAQRFASPNGTVTTATGGLLALPSNIGHFTRAPFSLVPEFTLNVGYQFTPHVRGFVGYNYLLWTNVLRPGDQIDTVINVQQIPNFPTNSPPSNANRPLVPFRQSDFWAQGLIVGVEITW